jgi:DNA-binding PadR family transcriptional regulator
VKQAFLAETLRPLYRLWVRTFGFVRYYYGPYSDEIFQRLDTLIFNGLVRVTMMERIGGKIEARYQITDSGHRALEHFPDSEFVQLAVDLVWALQALGVEQASTICRLVYQEAEFARVFAQHSEQKIPPSAKVPLAAITETDNQTFTTLAILQELQSRPSERIRQRNPP